MASSDEPLDLYDLAVLLNYERATTEPRFRHTKLREVAFPGSRPQIIAIGYPERDQGWIDNARTWVVLDRLPTGDSKTHDTPAHFTQGEEALTKNLSQQQVETIFHQILAHDGCFQAIGLLQIFFNLFPPNTKLKIRHAPIGKAPGRIVCHVNRQAHHHRRDA